MNLKSVIFSALGRGEKKEGGNARRKAAAPKRKVPVVHSKRRPSKPEADDSSRRTFKTHSGMHRRHNETTAGHSPSSRPKLRVYVSGRKNRMK